MLTSRSPLLTAPAAAAAAPRRYLQSRSLDVVLNAVECDSIQGVAYIAATITESGKVLEDGEVVKMYSNSFSVEYMAVQHKGAWKLARACTVPPVLG